MTRYIQLVDRADNHPQKQPREFIEHIKSVFGTTRFAKKDYMKLIDYSEPGTVLKNSKAVPSRTFDYYLNSLHELNFVKLYEDDVELINVPRKHNTLHRKRTNVSSTKLDTKLNTLLEARLIEVTEKLRAEYEAKLNELLAK